ncbi:MAG: peptidase S10 [Pseudomonadota bacterium]|nr:peptidase S10 [Pseudomonadota bacterium]
MALRAAFLIPALLLAACQSVAPEARAQPAPAENSPAAEAPELRRYEHAGAGVFGGERVEYRLVAEDTVLPGADGRPGAWLFSFSYLRTGVSDASGRPVLFVFNGGPGSASLWLHMGLFGPRRVRLDDPLNPPATGPFALEDNPHALLDVADIVLIDPPGTGFSRVLEGADPADFYGSTADAAAIARFIETWIDRHERWNSPRYLVGESYGTTRAALVARSLLGGPMDPSGRLAGIGIDGAVLMGQAVLSPDGPLARQVSQLTAMAATAHYHGKAGAGRPLEAFVDEAGAFARLQWLPALYAGDALSRGERRAIAESLAGYTGLPADRIEAADLRIPMTEFRRALLAGEGLEIGAYDGRYTVPLAGRPAMADPVGDDPAMARYAPAFVAGLNLYLAEAGIAVEDRYEAIAFRTVNRAWNHDISPPFIPAGEALAAAMRTNPDFRLLVATGYQDLVTTTGSADYLVAHAGLPAARVTVARYPSGHMPYLGDASARALAADIRTLISGGRLAPSRTPQP